jgi:hypothetical protein
MHSYRCRVRDQYLPLGARDSAQLSNAMLKTMQPRRAADDHGSFAARDGVACGLLDMDELENANTKDLSYGEILK